MSASPHIILAQSAAGAEYEAMLEATRATHARFCEINRIEFRSIHGVLRGFHPWQASYNRIELLHDLLEKRFRGWFLHLDADAVIRQPEFDMRRFLGKRANYALIAAAVSPTAEHWNLNNGVFFLNLGHPDGQEIVRRWHSAFHNVVSDDALRTACVPWRNPDGSIFLDDQHLLQMELKQDDALSGSLLLEDAALINHGRGRFIRQFLRAFGSPEERLAAIKQTIIEIS